MAAFFIWSYHEGLLCWTLSHHPLEPVKDSGDVYFKENGRAFAFDHSKTCKCFTGHFHLSFLILFCPTAHQVQPANVPL